MRTATNHAGFVVQIFHRRHGWTVCSPIYVLQQRAIDVMRDLTSHRARIRAECIADGVEPNPIKEYRVYSALEHVEPVERTQMQQWAQAIEDSVIAARIFFARTGSIYETKTENETGNKPEKGLA